MGIVNAGQLGVYDDIDEELREAVEDVVLNRRNDATERLLELAEKYRDQGEEVEAEAQEWRSRPGAQRRGEAPGQGNAGVAAGGGPGASQGAGRPTGGMEG